MMLKYSLLVILVIAMISIMIFIILNSIELCDDEISLIKFHKKMAITLTVIYFMVYVILLVTSGSHAEVVACKLCAKREIFFYIVIGLSIIPILAVILSINFLKRKIKNAEKIIYAFNLVTIFILIFEILFNFCELWEVTYA